MAGSADCVGMSTMETYPGRESAPVLENRNVFQAALILSWSPDESVQHFGDTNERAMAWIERYGAVYAQVYSEYGSELLAGSAKNREMLTKWQHRLDEYLHLQARTQDLAKHQPLD